MNFKISFNLGSAVNTEPKSISVPPSHFSSQHMFGTYQITRKCLLNG